VYKDLEITMTNGFTLDNPPENYDIIVLNRHSWQDEDYITRAKDKGVKIIIDIDDSIELPDWHSSKDNFRYPLIQERIKYSLSIADEVWCASEYLQTKLGVKSTYIPNAIDFSQPQFIPQKKKNDKYTIGWIGAANHQFDIEMLYEPLKKLMSRKDYNILLGGVSMHDSITVQYWNYIINLLTNGGQLPNDRFIKVEALNVYNYAFMYNLVDCLVAPLHKSEFTKCKSNIKVLEAGCFSLPIICSNIEPYKEFISQGLVYSSEGAWDKRMIDLIKNPIKGVNIGKALNEYVREFYNIETINKKRYESIINLMG